MTPGIKDFRYSADTKLRPELSAITRGDCIGHIKARKEDEKDQRKKVGRKPETEKCCGGNGKSR